MKELSLGHDATLEVSLTDAVVVYNIIKLERGDDDKVLYANEEGHRRGEIVGILYNTKYRVTVTNAKGYEITYDYGALFHIQAVIKVKHIDFTHMIEFLPTGEVRESVPWAR